MVKATIRKATSADVNHLVPVLVRAFDKDPAVNWFVRQDDKRVHGFEILFRTALRKLSLPHGEVLTTDGCLGGALWYPPGTSKIGFGRQLRLLPAMIQGCGFRRLKRMIEVVNNMERIHPTERHYYLQFIGTDPDHRQKGIGTALIRPVLEKCDQQGCGAYLENSTENNLAFYQGLGFEVVGEINLGRGAPLLRPMWRKPRIPDIDTD